MKYIIVFIIILMGSSWSYAQTFDDYFKIAAESNPGLQAKYKEYEAALQIVPQVNTLPDPDFSLGYFLSPEDLRSGPRKARFSLSQMFPWFGTLKAQGDAAALKAEARFYGFINARNALYFQVAASYYPLYELRQWTLIEQKNMDILQSYKAIATKKFENGTGSMVDVLRVDIMLKDAATNLEILNAKEKPLVTAFNKLLNRDANEPVSVTDSLILEPLPDKAITESLLSGNPSLKELNLQIKAGEASEKAAYKQGLPKFGVGVEYDYAIDDRAEDELMAMATVSIPVFRAKYKASVKEAQLMQKSYSLQKEELTNSLTSSYEMVWFEIQQQLQLLALYEQQIQTTRQALNLLFTSYSNSGKEFEEVLRMQQQLLKYEKIKAAAEAQYQIVLAKLNYLTGRTYYNENK